MINARMICFFSIVILIHVNFIKPSLSDGSTLIVLGDTCLECKKLQQVFKDNPSSPNILLTYYTKEDVGLVCKAYLKGDTNTYQRLQEQPQNFCNQLSVIKNNTDDILKILNNLQEKTSESHTIIGLKKEHELLKSNVKFYKVSLGFVFFGFACTLFLLKK